MTRLYPAISDKVTKWDWRGLDHPIVKSILDHIPDIPWEWAPSSADPSQAELNHCRSDGCYRSIGQDEKYCFVHKKQYALDKPSDCPICLEPLTEADKPWRCGHYAHDKCVAQCSDDICCICRAELEMWRLIQRRK